METGENVVWKGRSSQIVNFLPFVISLLIAAIFIVPSFFFSPFIAIGALIPLAYAAWLWLNTKVKVFEFTTERLRVYEGVLNQEINEVELYRVKDTKIQKPFWIRLFGLSTLIIDTSDRSSPVVEIAAVRNGSEIREKLRAQVEILRDRKRVREVDFDGSGADGMADIDDFDMA
jgi:membrane protein YdbS with pleckstrin-like domain